jgi:hypothetical protein
MGKVSNVPVQANPNQMVLASQATDLAVILRNVRDLAKTASFLNTDDIAELHQLAFKNLKDKMVLGGDGVPGVLMVDPVLSMEAYKLVSTVQMQVVETKRKSVDTLLKARALLDLSVPVEPEEGSDDDDPFNEEAPDGVVIQDAGVFGGVIEAGNRLVDEGEAEGAPAPWVSGPQTPVGLNDEGSYDNDSWLPDSQPADESSIVGAGSGPQDEVDTRDIPF